MQLDLLTKMRENKIYENREKFARHANQPASFSSLQMQEYLKASAFRCVSLSFWRTAESVDQTDSLCLHANS